MKKLILTFLLFNTLISIAQAPFGNEWIDYSKPHYKFNIAQTGVYRIPFNTLSAVFPGAAIINPNDITLFCKGQKIPIYVSWTASPTSSDFIEFLGKGMDGEIDSKLYAKESDQLNPYISIFNDTAVYYLTTRSGSNPRLTPTVNDLTSLPPKESWFYYKAISSYNNSYSTGRRQYLSTYDYVIIPGYDQGEGYGSANFLTASSNFISTPFINTSSGVNSSIKTRLIGFNAGTHRLSFTLNSNLLKDSTFANPYAGTSFFGDFDFSFQSSLLTSNNNYTINPILNRYHGYMIGFIEITYPRDFNFGAANTFEFSILGNNAKQYLEINNFTFSTGNPVLYDLSSGLRIAGVVPASGNPLRLALPASSNKRNLFLFNENQFQNITSITPKTFIDLSSINNQGNYVMIYHPKLTNDGLGNNRVANYKTYRESSAGGGFQVSSVPVDELYEQFSYGMNKNPLAIKKFIQFSKNFWNIKPKFVLLVGKGRPNGDTKNASIVNSILIPTMGVAPSVSDIALSMTDTSFESLVPIGRIAAETGDELNNYLNKVKEYEAERSKIGDPFQTINRKDNNKWAIHLGGGSGLSQQNTYSSALKFYEGLFNKTKIGGTVYGLYKDNSSIQVDKTSEMLKNLINRGVSQITFFGHSAATIFDVGIDEPEYFTNAGKYPFFLANGCNSGYIFSSSKGYSERFVLLPNKGSIGFLATANFSFDDALIEYSKMFYEHLTTKSYGLSYGEIIQATSNDLASIFKTNPLNNIATTSQEFVLHGDPAITPPYYNLPDYVIEPQNISFNPGVINTSQGSFKVRMLIENLGKSIEDSIQIEVTRIIGKEQYVYTQKFKAPYYMDSFDIIIPTIENGKGTGINKFNFKIESENKITELSETNNILDNQISTLIVSDDIFPVYPLEFSIVNKQNIVLKANTSDLLAKSRNYIFELDTTELFNSPLKQNFKTISKGGLINWSPNITMIDSTVYYWRAAYDVPNPKWNNSSFIYINNESSGWNQSHYFQYKKDEFNANVLLDTNNRNLKFVDNLKTINVKTRGNQTVNWGYGEIEWNLNNARQQAFRENNYINSGLNIVWIDKNTGLPVISQDTLYGSTNYGSYGSIGINYDIGTRSGFVFPDTGLTPSNHPFKPNQPWSTVIHDFLNNIPIGDYIIIYTLKRTKYTAWDNPLKLEFLSLGASKITDLTSGLQAAPFIFACKKGDPSFTPIQKIGNSFNNITDTSFTISGSWFTGNFKSTIIGPALSWGSLHWKYFTLDNVNNDEQNVSVIGITPQNQEVNLTKIWSNDTSINQIAASQYPYLKLQFNATDVTNRTPAQLKYWRVLYRPAPEMAFNPNRFFDFKDTFQEGETVEMKIALDNLSEEPFDSVYIQSDFQLNNVHSVKMFKNDSLRANQEQIVTVRAQNPATLGQNILSLEANPIGPFHQLENYQFNNLLQKQYFVSKDMINPLLDITFDGVRIMNKEIVSSKPVIVVILKDDNKYLPLNDTSYVNISIKYPDNTVVPILYNNPQLKFIPADISKGINMARLEYRPEFTIDGEYELIVKDKDVSGNRSGNKKSYDYNIAFTIFNKQTITRLLNYPNPFTTRTQFIFTLTGNKIPDYIKIQILTISGKIVREISKEELGPLRIGMNKTQFWWDGTDTYGDALANGVYLYKVVIKDQGKDVEQRPIFTSEKVTNDLIEKAFTSGYGKMVLIR